MLVARNDHIGDVFMACSILPHIKRVYPGCKIDFLAGVWTGELLENNPYIERHLVYNSIKANRSGSPFISKAFEAASCFIRNAKEMRLNAYDVCIDLRTYPANSVMLLGLGKGLFNAGFATGGWGFLLDAVIPYREGVHETAHLADALGVLGIKAGDNELQPEFSLGAKDMDAAETVLRAVGVKEGERYCVLHTGSGNPAKLWKKEGWQELIDALKRDRGLTPVVYDVVYGDWLRGCIRLPHLLKLTNFAGILKGASLFVGLDSMPGHLAASFGTPTLVVWCGINDPVRWRPIGKRVLLVKKDVACSPCSLKDGCAGMECIDITASECIAGAGRLLEEADKVV